MNKIIGINKPAVIQKKITRKNELGEDIVTWEDLKTVRGYLDLQGQTTKYSAFYTKLQESTHVFLTDYFDLKNITSLKKWSGLHGKYNGSGEIFQGNIVDDISLPKGYTQLDYIIPNNVGVLIDHVANLNTSIEIDLEITNTTTGSCTLCCCRVLPDSNACDLLVLSDNKLLVDYGTNRKYNVLRFTTNKRHVIKLDKNKVYLDGNLITTITLDPNVDTINNTTPIMLFESYTTYSNQMTTFTNYLVDTKIYGVKVWDNDVLVGDYIPCMTNDNVGLLNKFDITTIESYNKGLSYNVNGLRLAFNDKKYDIMLIDNPMELNEHLEIYLKKYTGDD